MDETNRVPVSYWIVSTLALIWNGLGFFAYYARVTATPEAIAQMYESPAAIDFVSGMPVWATAGQAIAVTAGILGGVAMLLRRALAKWLFIASLAGVLLQNTYGFVVADGVGIFGISALILPLVVILVAVSLIIYVGKADEKGWLD